MFLVSYSGMRNMGKVKKKCGENTRVEQKQLQGEKQWWEDVPWHFQKALFNTE